jgi:hypothetical protein
MKRPLSLLLPLLLLLVLVLGSACESESGCAADDSCGAAPDDEQAVAVLPGKADNYLSPTSREYSLWGMGEVQLEAEWADRTADERAAEVQTRLGDRFKAYAHFVNVYLTDKTSHDSNAGYGGFSGLVRKTSLDWIREPVDDAELVWAFIWELEMGGPRDLMDRLPFETRPDGTQVLMVTMPALTDAQLRAGSYSDSFDPGTYGGPTTQIEVMVDPVAESVDAWPAYDQLFADGLLDVAVIVGGDYNAERYDLRAAREIYAWLKRAGYRHESADFAALTIDAAPFTKTIRVEGREVAVQVTLLHPDVVEDAALDQLRARIVQAYEAMDVVIYDGHAGQDPNYSGIVYHYNPRHAISANGLAELNLPEKYQLFVFNGCKTYSAYPEAVYRNARKTTANLDVVSTVSFSWLTMQPYTTSGLLNELLATAGGAHDPRTYGEVLATINKDANWNVYYGVHGLDDNSHRNPYADEASLCRTCARDAECPGQGNRCVRFDWGSACGVECTSDAGCPDGYACADIATGSRITGKQCLPTNFRCE